MRREVERDIRQRIERDVASRLLPADTNSASLAALVIAVIQGMSVLARDGHGRETLVGVADAAMMAWPDRRRLRRVPPGPDRSRPS